MEDESVLSRFEAEKRGGDCPSGILSRRPYPSSYSPVNDNPFQRRIKMAFMMRSVRQRFCFHHWMTIWIGREAVYDICLLCRKRTVDRQGGQNRLNPARITFVSEKC
jgi:hypothetical protein